MSTPSERRFAPIVLLVTSMMGCSPITGSGTDGGNDRPAPEVAGDLDEHPGGDASNSNHPILEDPSPSPVDPWAVQRDCRTPSIEWYPTSWTFQKPDAPPRNFDDTMTKSQLEQALPRVEPPHRSIATGTAPHHQPGTEWNSIWGMPGEPVRLSFYFRNVLDSLEGHRIYATALVNYRPVDARWVRWLSDRDGASQEWEGSGISFEVAEEGELVDLEIPAATFTTSGVYEVSLHLKMGRPHHKHFDSLRRYHLFYGGFEWPKMDCYESPMADAPNEAERETADRVEIITFKEGLSRVRGRTTAEEVMAPVVVAPGEKVDVEVSMFNKFGVDVPTAAVPTLQGRPLTSEPWLFHISERGSGSNSIAARRRLRFELPEDPGAYDFQVSAWYHAMMPTVSPDGTPFPGVSPRRGGSTNSIRFIVEN